MVNDYISREALLRMIDHRPTTPTTDREDRLIRAAINTIKNFPAADVRPVVRCKDCKHSDTFSPDCTEATFPLKCLSIRYGGVYPDWFCEHGKKREES